MAGVLDIKDNIGAELNYKNLDEDTRREMAIQIMETKGKHIKQPDMWFVLMKYMELGRDFEYLFEPGYSDFQLEVLWKSDIIYNIDNTGLRQLGYKDEQLLYIHQYITWNEPVQAILNPKYSITQIQLLHEIEKYYPKYVKDFQARIDRMDWAGIMLNALRIGMDIDKFIELDTPIEQVQSLLNYYRGVKDCAGRIRWAQNELSSAQLNYNAAVTNFEQQQAHIRTLIGDPNWSLKIPQ